MNAAKMGAVAALIFPDPVDYKMSENIELYGHVSNAVMYVLILFCCYNLEDWKFLQMERRQLITIYYILEVGID